MAQTPYIMLEKQQNLIAANHELVLGRSYFKDNVEEMTQMQARLGKPGRPRIEEEQGDYLIVF